MNNSVFSLIQKANFLISTHPSVLAVNLFMLLQPLSAACFRGIVGNTIEQDLSNYPQKNPEHPKISKAPWRQMKGLEHKGFSMTKGKQPWKYNWKSRFTSGDLSIKGRQDKAPFDWRHKSLKQN